MIFTACATELYHPVVERLRESLEAVDIELVIGLYECKGSWLANCKHIPIHILEIMEAHPNDNLVYTDADATFEDFPDLLYWLDRSEYDLGCYWLPRADGRLEFLNGTMFIRNNETMRSFFKEHIEEDKKNPTVLEQRTMERLLPNWLDEIEVYELPPEYCRIFDNRRQAETMTSEAVIVHHQASREMRDKVGKA